MEPASTLLSPPRPALLTHSLTHNPGVPPLPAPPHDPGHRHTLQGKRRAADHDGVRESRGRRRRRRARRPRPASEKAAPGRGHAQARVVRGGGVRPDKVRGTSWREGGLCGAAARARCIATQFSTARAFFLLRIKPTCSLNSLSLPCTQLRRRHRPPARPGHRPHWPGPGRPARDLRPRRPAVGPGRQALHRHGRGRRGRGLPGRGRRRPVQPWGGRL